MTENQLASFVKELNDMSDYIDKENANFVAQRIEFEKEAPPVKLSFWQTIKCIFFK
jgi:hypothetical protein